MRLDELINEKYNILNDNDLLIWQYIQGHKKECCSISIEKLAAKCCISRTTISRFTQKLGFEGFKEFKIRLKMEYENDQVKKKVVLDDVCTNYIKCIQTAKDMDVQEVCEHIERANRLFIFGTGETQNAAAQMMKRIFMYAKKFFVVLAGESELRMALEDIEENDMMIIISLSGENQMAVNAAKKVKGKGAYLLSLTELSNNTLARLSDKSMYITTNHLLRTGPVSLETCASYYNVVEILCVKYFQYLQQKQESNEQ